MKIIDIENAKAAGADDDCVKIVLDKNNISKFPIQTLYCKERGFRNFMLEYDYENIDESFEKITHKIKTQIFNLVKDHGFKFYLSGFPRCVYEQGVMKPNMRWDNGENIFFVRSKDEKNDIDKDYFKCASCGYRDLCDGLNLNYPKKHQFHYGPLASTEEVVELLDEEFDFFYNDDLQALAKLCSEDYLKSEEFNEKKIVFRKRVSSGSDEFKEGFFYKIYNNKNKFDEIMTFLKGIYSETFLSSIEKYLSNSKIISLGFEVLSDDVLRKRIFFSVDTFEESLKEDLIKKLNVTPRDDLDFRGVYIEESNDIEVVELAYILRNIENTRAKELISDFELDQKRLILKFLNSLTKKLCKAIYVEKFDSGSLIAKKFEFEIDENPVRIKDLGILYGFNLKFFMEKEILSLVFETSQYQSEKIIFAYSLIPPEPVEDYGEEYDFDEEENLENDRDELHEEF